MIKVFYFFCNIDKYYSNTSIVNLFKILFHNQKIFHSNNINLTPFIQLIPQLNQKQLLTNLSKEEMDSYLDLAMLTILNDLPSLSQQYEKIIFLGFHPKPFQPMMTHYQELKKYPNVYTILWQDDLQAYFKDEKRTLKLNYADQIITPSPVYFENVAPQYLEKTKFFFYVMDFRFIKGLSQKFSRRKNKIILSGCVNPQYRIRQEISQEINNSPEFAEIADYLHKPKMKEYNYKDGTELPYGKNYYKILGSYKGAFFGYYDKPMNFNLAKIIEILSLGCIGFFEESPLLEKELNLKPLVHYVPCTKNGKLITKIKYYEYFLNNIDNIGQKIAENGRKFCEENFSNKNAINNYINIFNNIGKI